MTTTTTSSDTHSAGLKSSADRGGSDQLGDTAQAMKDGAGDMLKDVKNAARTRLSEEKDGAASGIDNVASALRDVAKEPDQGASNEMLTTLASSAADGLEKLSSGLRGKDVGTLLRDVQSFAREQPVAFFGLTMAAGFMAARFLKASEPESGSERFEGSHASTSNAQQHSGYGR
jgi:hypothetical protein